MKIIIEGSPKEIAAFERQLIGGKTSVDEIAKEMYGKLKQAAKDEIQN